MIKYNEKFIRLKPKKMAGNNGIIRVVVVKLENHNIIVNKV